MITIHATSTCPKMQGADESITDPDEWSDVNCPACIRRFQLKGVTA